MTPGSAETNKAIRGRDARIRWRMLQALHGARGNEHGGWITGRFVVDVVNGYLPQAEHVESDDHALQLFRDLVNKGLAREEDNREDRGQPYTLDYITFVITAAGSSFVNRALPADAEIDDGRIVKR